MKGTRGKDSKVTQRVYPDSAGSCNTRSDISDISIVPADPHSSFALTVRLMNPIDLSHMELNMIRSHVGPNHR